MKIQELQRYSPLYTSAKQAGAAKSLNRSFGFKDDQVVPLGISHGVDFHMCYTPMDIHSIEPIHWAYNRDLLERAKLIKPAVLLPHPWWFIAKERKITAGDGVLVIAGPPGKTNDERLLSTLKKNYDKTSITILLKQRGDIKKSERFWNENGINTVTAGPLDDGFYPRLFKIICSYLEILCCTFSSAVIFAASIGKKVSFTKDYTYLAYDVSHYQSIVNYNSRPAKEIVSRFVHDEKEDVTQLAREILGFSSEPIEEIKSKYIECLHKIQRPTFQKSAISLVMREISIATKKPSIALLTPRKFAEKLFYIPKVIQFEQNEISVWLDGQNSDNFKIKEVVYVKGHTEPGSSVD